MSRTFLGQNFLVDPQVQQKICKAFQPPAEFGEIGPGKGALTFWLEKTYPNFSVFEKDPELARIFKEKPALRVIEGDFCNWDFSIDQKPVSNFSLIGNLPYESGTRMLLQVLEHVPQVVHFVFMLQKEVVSRICAKPHSRDFGSLSVLVQTYYQVNELFSVSPSAFRPIPKVDSSVVGGRLRADAPPPDLKFMKFVQSCFLHKRKMLKNAIRSRFEPELVARALQGLGLSDKVRAEEIPVDLWPKFYGDLDRDQAPR